MTEQGRSALTSPSSKLIRAGRRGAQLALRARSPNSTRAAPTRPALVLLISAYTSRRRLGGRVVPCPEPSSGTYFSARSNPAPVRRQQGLSCRLALTRLSGILPCLRLSGDAGQRAVLEGTGVFPVSAVLPVADRNS